MEISQANFISVKRVTAENVWRYLCTKASLNDIWYNTSLIRFTKFEFTVFVKMKSTDIVWA